MCVGSALVGYYKCLVNVTVNQLHINCCALEIDTEKQKWVQKLIDFRVGLDLI